MLADLQRFPPERERPPDAPGAAAPESVPESDTHAASPGVSTGAPTDSAVASRPSAHGSSSAAHLPIGRVMALEIDQALATWSSALRRLHDDAEAQKLGELLTFHSDSTARASRNTSIAE